MVVQWLTMPTNSVFIALYFIIGKRMRASLCPSSLTDLHAQFTQIPCWQRTYKHVVTNVRPD